MKVPTLDTPRLRLRPPRMEDVDHFIELHGDAKVMKYITNGRPQSPREARDYLINVLDKMNRQEQMYYYWLGQRRDNGGLIGWYTLRKLEDTEENEIGYRLLQSAWGHGFGTEGSAALLQFAFEALDLPNVMALAIPENRASRRIMEKIGMQYRKTGRFYDTECVYYSLAKNDFMLKSKK